MEINNADVAELVDARDLKFAAPAENKAVFCKTPAKFLAEPARTKRDLQNAFGSLERWNGVRKGFWLSPYPPVTPSRPSRSWKIFSNRSNIFSSCVTAMMAASW